VAYVSEYIWIDVRKKRKHVIVAVRVVRLPEDGTYRYIPAAAEALTAHSMQRTRQQMVPDFPRDVSVGL